MRIPAFLQKFGRDLVYLGIIGCMVGWIWMDGRREEAWNEMVRRDFQISKDLLSRLEWIIFSQIQKNSSEYYDEKTSDSVLKKANLVKKSTDEFSEKVANLLHSLWAENLEKPYAVKRPLSNTELNMLESNAGMLYDSLMVCADGDKDISSSIAGFLGQNSIGKIWEIGRNLSASQTPAYMQSLILEANLMALGLLGHLDSKLQPPIDCFSGWMPIASSEKHTLRPGEIYHADIFLSQYSRSRNVGRNVTMKVNGKPLTIKNGLAHFSQRYTSPGEKKYEVQIDLRNPLTGVTDTYKKEFGLVVVDTCR